MTKTSALAMSPSAVSLSVVSPSIAGPSFVSAGSNSSESNVLRKAPFRIWNFGDCNLFDICNLGFVIL
jgi:hypothetical protein